MSASWHAAYRNFDDEALAALASVGLLRRAAKDVEAGKVGWSEPAGDERGVIAADGQRVSLSPKGPVNTACDCPAPGVCKHILAAALWLRATPTVDVAATAPTTAPPADVLAEVLALDAALLFKECGRAAVRKAAALLATRPEVQFVVQGSVLVIRLPELDLECRYIAGTGFAGMVSELEARTRKALHLLAVGAVLHAHGRGLSWPEEPEQPAAGAGESSAVLSGDERTLPATVRAHLLEICANGWSHVSDVTAPQLRTLATSARVDAFPRLAGLLRTLAGIADALARRDFGADERQALRLAAQAFALTHALEHAGGEALDRLRGAERRSFSDHQDLELLPLGGHWWEQRSGARGLTVSFWSPAQARVMESVLARRDASDPGFTRSASWSMSALWEGAGPPCALMAGALVLSGARMSDDGRLASAGATRATRSARWGSRDPRWEDAGFDDWSLLAGRVRAAAGLLGEPLDSVLLRPSSCALPQLDEAAQLLRWTVHDRHGAPLVLRLPYEHWKRTRFDSLVEWARSGAAIDAIVARLDRALHGGILEPLSLIVERNGTPHSISLDFDAGPAGPQSSLAARLGRMFKGRATPAAMAAPQAHLGVVDTLLSQLEHKGMTGRLHLVDGSDELHAVHRQLLGVGLDALATPLARYLARPDAGLALALIHVAHTCLDLDTAFLQR